MCMYKNSAQTSKPNPTQLTPPLEPTHPGSLQHVVGGDGLALLLPGAVVGARGQVNDEYAARAGEDAGGILADVGA